MTAFASTSWQDQIRESLITRNQTESSHADIIQEYRKLAKQTKALKDRNQALLRAATSVRSDGRASEKSGGGGGGDDNPVLQAYVGSLETQISALRNELSDVYKMQGQNTQKLLTMTENLQEKEHQARLDQEELRRLVEGETKWKRGTEEWKERLKEKDNGIQILQDEIATLTLELNHTSARNEALKKDNASLLQRWIDKMNEEAEGMNLANEVPRIAGGGPDFQ